MSLVPWRPWDAMALRLTQRERMRIVRRWHDVLTKVAGAIVSHFGQLPGWSVFGTQQFDPPRLLMLGDWLEDTNHPATTEYREALAAILYAIKEPTQ